MQKIKENLKNSKIFALAMGYYNTSKTFRWAIDTEIEILRFIFRLTERYTKDPNEIAVNKEIREKEVEFEEIDCIDQPNKEYLLPIYKICLEKVLRTRSKRTTTELRIGMYILIAALVSYILFSPHILIFIFTSKKILLSAKEINTFINSSNPLQDFGSFVFTLICGYIFIPLFLGLDVALLKILKKVPFFSFALIILYNALIFLLGWMHFIDIIHFIKINITDEREYYLLLDALIIIPFSLTSVLIIIIAIILSTIFDRFRELKILTNENLIIEYITVIINMDNLLKNKFDMSYRKNQLQALDKIASCIELGLISNLKTGDNNIDLWAKEQFKRIATAVREKKKWIILPKQDTNIYLLKSVTSSITNIIENNWDALEQAEPEKISRNKQWQAILLASAKTISIATLPALCLLAFELTPLKLEDPIRQYAIIGSLLWVILTFVIALDANINLKISTAKDILSLLPLGQRKE